MATLAREAGFTQVSASHNVSPLMKFVSRGDTTVVDAYLSPILRRYVEQVAGELPGARLMFMQSSGGLTDAHRFQGKDSILSGPAGGIVGMVRTAEAAGFGKVIGFDMGGTSTDVALVHDLIPRMSHDNQIDAYPLRYPQLDIHTIGAGGGSIVWIGPDQTLRIGPHSAGAVPGPACYGRGGTLPTISDANLLLGRLSPDRALAAPGTSTVSVNLVGAKSGSDRFAAGSHQATVTVRCE